MKPYNIKKIDSTNNLEQWKFTNSKEFISKTIFIAPFKTLDIKCDDYELIIYNGILSYSGSIFKKNKLLLKEIKNGFSITIPKNTTIEKPIVIKHIIDCGNKDNFLNYNNLIQVGGNSNITIINEEIFPVNHCINIDSKVIIEKNSNLEIISPSEKPKTKQLLNFSAYLNENSTLKIHAIDLTAKLIKNNYFIFLNGKGSECLFNGFNIINNKNHIDNYIKIYHKNKYTTSNLNYKSIANDSSKSILFAKAIIEKNSINSEAYQKNNNLMLSSKATIHSNPQLEIYNNDVKCSHGSTTGQLDEEAIFYMKSRGINEIKAKTILMRAFLNEVVDQITPLNIRDNIRNNMDKLLLSVN